MAIRATRCDDYDQVPRIESAPTDLVSGAQQRTGVPPPHSKAPGFPDTGAGSTAQACCVRRVKAPMRALGFIDAGAVGAATQPRPIPPGTARAVDCRDAYR